MTDVAGIIGNIELEIFKSAVEKWLDGYVAKGDITAAQAGTMTAGAEDFLGLATTLYAASKAAPTSGG